jgi:hypothetical protein
MPIDLELTPKDANNDLEFHLQYKDAAGFLEACRAIKSTVTELIRLNLRYEAMQLLEVYESTFRRAHDWDQNFILEVLDEFPVNHYTTFALLTVSDEIDQAIMATKVDTKTRPANQISGYDHLLLYAIEKNDLALMEGIIVDACEMVKTKYACCPVLMQDVSASFVQTLVFEANAQHLSSPRIDEAIASILDKGDQEMGIYIDKLARLKMPKTLMKMLEHDRVAKHLQASHEEFDHILACIPEKMTSRELNAVLFHLEPTGMAEKILFDENIDFDGFIDSLSQTTYKCGRGNTTDLGLSCSRYFVDLITVENFKDPLKKSRITKLLNAMCEADLKHAELRLENIRTRAIRHELPPFCLKHINCLRGSELEDALGL